MSEVTEGVLNCSGGPIRYAEFGKGTTVVVFHADGGTLVDDMATALAADHRVLVLDVSSLRGTVPQDFATSLIFALAKLGVTSFSLIGASQAVPFALAQALYTAEAVTGLVLVSPPLASVQQFGPSDNLAQVKTPTLVMVGTRDRSGAREAGRLCRAQIPACHLLLVYEAGPNIMADRREACLSPMREFLVQGEGFIVTHESQLIRP